MTYEQYSKRMYRLFRGAVHLCRSRIKSIYAEAAQRGLKVERIYPSKIKLDENGVFSDWEDITQYESFVREERRKEMLNIIEYIMSHYLHIEEEIKTHVAQAHKARIERIIKSQKELAL